MSHRPLLPDALARDRFIDELLAVFSHEFKTPLNFIMGFASTLQDELQGPMNADQHAAIDRIMTGAERLLCLFDDFLDYARIRSGRAEIACERVDYTGLVEAAVAAMAAAAEKKDLTLRSELQQAVELVIDPRRIAWVITSLLANAIKFTEPGGTVTVRTRGARGTLVTEIADTGIGIAPEHLAMIFESFQQLDMSSTRRSGGIGLGLALARALVEAHGGTLEATSVPGEGSVFHFLLPTD